MIRIMKASAGSGKTFKLAQTYLRVLLSSNESYAFRSILAVTFTNKATAEMKGRILEELYKLAVSPEKSDYFAEFVPSLFPDAHALKAKASKTLTELLHDYGSFSVSTIDRFFQQALRAFAREAGQFAAYQIELDKPSLVHEAVDSLLDSLSEDDSEILDWLTDSLSVSMDKGSRPDFEGRLYEMAEKLFSTERQDVMERLGIKGEGQFSRESLKVISARCRDVISDYEKAVRDCAKECLDIISAAGLSTSDFFRSFMEKLPHFVYFPLPPSPPEPTPAFLARAKDPDGWFSKAAAPKCLPLVEESLSPALSRFCYLFEEGRKLSSSAALILSQIHGLAVSSELTREFEGLLKEKNVLSLDDSNAILRRMIDGSDAPFVYEKMGVRYRHFLLDEFQDTSMVQWENFLPLLKESDSTGGSNLVVGDVKQSIYRWRDSRWDLLDSGVQRDFPLSEIVSLTENWRSSRAVVEFNNDFFSHAAALLDPRLDGASFSISDIYSDVEQTPCADEAQEGCVRVTFCSDKDEQMEKVIESISRARQAGALWSDIAVLVRTNLIGGRVAHALLQTEIPVLSDDSLDLKGSVTVRRVVGLMESFENPDDQISSYIASMTGMSFPDCFHSLPDLCESLLRSLRDADSSLFESETLYIQSFMDTLLDWTSRNGNSISRFLSWWKDAKVKLSSPAGADAVRVITIHKSKGLEFPHVIYPFAEAENLTPSTKHPPFHWCIPDESLGAIPEAAETAFPITMTGKAANTCFSRDYADERNLCLVDALNASYVALTRAQKSLHVIAERPSDPVISAIDKGDVSKLSTLSHLLMEYTGEDEYVSGEPYDFSRMKRKDKKAPEAVPSSYPSYPASGGVAKEDSESYDFFSEDGLAGAGASPRLSGIALHEILSRVDMEGGLERAVSRSVEKAILSPEEGKKAYELLSRALSSPEVSEWFNPAYKADTERTLIDAQGECHIPDRVVRTPSSTIVIDYKFGEPKPSYHRQVRRYMEILRQLGCVKVSGYLWYVRTGEIEKVE